MFEKSSVFALVNQNDGPGVYLINMDDPSQKEICGIFSRSVSRLNEKEKIPFDGKYKPDSDESLIIEEFVIEDNILDAIRKPLSLPTLSRSDNDSPDIRAIFVGDLQESNNTESFTVAFQRFRRDQYLSTRRINLFFDHDTFQKESRWGISISDTVDCLFAVSELQFESYYFTRQIFDLSQYYRVATDSEVEQFSQSDVLDVPDKKTFIEQSDDWMRRKIASINDSEVLADFSAKKIQSMAKAAGLKIKVKSKKIQIPTEKKPLKEVLRFLDEEVYKGAFSKETFIANSKRKANNS
ncbi:Kiwa anti-phage protein KwaB-like domain-containing protein [Schleiferilactobacillus perolens]|uniref:DUF4868 domain-containing protein n=1 Tax=Schleiferilactobacillus perolens DSM 12744 TaxID=1423792 RepID=A0A0R1MX27_9LACO|nr:Kiwa anti-phage protein KwaB-like domain-containing protein [Schleiferilactobacillus perolens]KRL12577.1 hypothetical protein FD09_GL002896 [Schleiferilactobacillus perolens DSM 12744]